MVTLATPRVEGVPKAWCPSTLGTVQGITLYFSLSKIWTQPWALGVLPDNQLHSILPMLASKNWNE